MTPSNSIAISGAAADARAGKLLEAYGPEAPFFLATPQRTLLAQGVAAIVSDPRSVTDALAPGDVAVGAVPFDDRAAARLIVPRVLHGVGPLGDGALPPRTPLAELAIRPVPAPQAYARGVSRAIALMRTGALHKVVLSRTLEVDLARPMDVRPVLQRLVRQNPGGYRFAVALGGEDAPRTLIGASPELLVSRTGLRVTAEPLAGSAARSADPAEDQRRAARLLMSDKDRHEHAIVADAVVAALRPFCRHLHVPASPSLRHTRTMWHLASRITGELAEPAASSLALALALHPTPAVCGEPVDRARAAIADIEPFDRGFFTGMVGWCDAAGDGEWAVTIRCAEVAERTIRLFAGAGVVAASDPEHELAETSAKLRTMLDALGVERPREMA